MHVLIEIQKFLKVDFFYWVSRGLIEVLDYIQVFNAYIL